MATRFASHLLTGSHASRPAATAVPEGSLYSCTTHSLIYQSDGATWATYATLGSTETLGATIIDAKGDLIGGTAADTAARLAVGTNAQVLTADSAETTGMKWATPSAGAAGAITLLHTLTLGSAGTFDQASISGAYNDLVCVAVLRGARSAINESANWNLNNDTTASKYQYQTMDSAATSAAALGTANAGTFQVGITGDTALAASFAAVQFEIFNYASTSILKPVHWKTFALYSVGASNMRVTSGGGLFNTTAAVTRIQIVGAATANLVTGSQLRIYGRL